MCYQYVTVTLLGLFLSAPNILAILNVLVAGNSWHEEINDKAKKNFSSSFYYVLLGPPQASNAKPQYSMYVAFTCVWYPCIWQYHGGTNTQNIVIGC